jgi:hypothetical protein
MVVPGTEQGQRPEVILILRGQRLGEERSALARELPQELLRGLASARLAEASPGDAVTDFAVQRIAPSS